MNKRDLSKLQALLLSEKTRLLLPAPEVMARERSGDAVDEAVTEEIISTELHFRDRNRFLLGKILGAINRLEEGTIDECEDCGEAIGIKRLLARPVATFCVDCKEAQERRESITGTVRNAVIKFGEIEAE